MLDYLLIVETDRIVDTLISLILMMARELLALGLNHRL